MWNVTKKETWYMWLLLIILLMRLGIITIRWETGWGLKRQVSNRVIIVVLKPDI